MAKGLKDKTEAHAGPLHQDPWKASYTTELTTGYVGP